MDTPTLQNGDSIRQSQIGTSSLFDRKIEFHLARKPHSGVVNFDSKFQLETLNPSVVSNGNLVREVKSGNQMVVERSEGVSLGKRGFDDPELSLRISFKRIGAGLENLGNTCFLNSVLQCLTYTEPLVAYLQSGRHQSSCQIAGFCALCAIQKHVSRALHATGRSLAPKDLVSNLRCISRTFRNARQEDAHEYMVQLLESMHKCCLPKGVPSESPSAYEKSLVHKIFGGRLQSQVRCLQCSYCSNKYDPFLDLSLEIAKADNLPKALVHFTAKEELDDGAKQYQCPQCKQKVRAVKQLTVHEAPYVLTIHLKRFSALDPGQKIDKKVAFSPKLDLKPFVSGTHEGSLMYTLYGVLVHAGWCTRSGHYYCFVRTSTGMWYSLDDNRVIQVNESTVLNQKAYMLFYVRDRKISPQTKPGCITLNEKTSSQENNLILNLTKGLKVAGQNGSLEKHVGGECSDNATKVDISMKKEMQTQEKSGNDDSRPAHVAAMLMTKNGSLEKHVGGEHSENATNTISLKKEAKREKKSGTGGSIPANTAALKTTPSILNGTPSQNGNNISNGTDVIKSQLPTKTSGDSEGSLGNGTVALIKENSLKKDAFISADISPSFNMDQYSKNKIAVMPENRPQTVSDGCSSREGVTSDSTVENPANKADTTITAEMPSNLPISNKANIQMKILECNHMLKPKKRLLKPLVVTMRLSTNVMCGSSKRFLNKKRRQKRRSVLKNQSSSQIILENTVSTSDTVQVACTHRQRKEQSPSKEKIIVPVKNKLHSRNTPSGTINSECNPKANPGDAVLAASKSVKCGSRSKIQGVDAKHCVNSRVEKVPASRSGLKRSLEEPIVARWDGTLASTEELASVTCASTKIGYVPDEWDEEYDRGKRKKVKSAKYSYDGTNPFQEIATSKASSIKSKNDRSSSANRPYRIL